MSESDNHLMKDSLLLPESKKLFVIFRVEADCLGLEGKDLVDEFCAFVQIGVESLDSDYVKWSIVPRKDKKLPEI